MVKEPIHILRQIKKGLGCVLVLAVVCELLFFPTLSNAYGCFMAAVSYGVFCYFLKEKYIRLFPFSFCMYLSMFMYRYLPLIATIVERKPITYGFERPYETFVYEIILFLISSFAFYLACQKTEYIGKNNVIQKSLFKLGFFKVTPEIIWAMGTIGLVIRLYNFSAGDVEYGDVGGKFLLGLDYLMYAPLCLFFPSLMKLKYNNQKVLLVYGLLIFILNIASNSRRQIIIPIGIIIILLFLYLVLNNLKITTFLSPFKIAFFGLALILLLNLISNISLAMLYTRKVRSDIGKLELFQQTIDVINDKVLMDRLKIMKDQESTGLISYQEGWTEHYVDNFMLARYANVRITDETLYYAEKKGYSNKQMQILFVENIQALFPTPILSLFGVYIDKSKLEFSRGDFLYGSGFGGYRVTSHVGDGLATFGFWYFLIQFIVYFFIFKLLNSFVFCLKEEILYAPFALMNVFTFLGKFRNATGITGDLSYVIRGFAQGVITYFIIFYLVRTLLWLVDPKYVENDEVNYPSS